jgi:hypothetical protein
MDPLTLFGVTAVTSMILQGAWPFGVVEAVWAGVAARRWRVKTQP